MDFGKLLPFRPSTSRRLGPSSLKPADVLPFAGLVLLKRLLAQGGRIVGVRFPPGHPLERHLAPTEPEALDPQALLRKCLAEGGKIVGVSGPLMHPDHPLSKAQEAARLARLRLQRLRGR